MVDALVLPPWLMATHVYVSASNSTTLHICRVPLAYTSYLGSLVDTRLLLLYHAMTGGGTPCVSHGNKMHFPTGTATGVTMGMMTGGAITSDTVQ